MVPHGGEGVVHMRLLNSINILQWWVLMVPHGGDGVVHMRLLNIINILQW